MKVILELETKDFKFNEEVTRDQIIKFLQKKVGAINDLIRNSKLNDGDYERGDPNHPMSPFLSDLKVINFR